MRDADTLARLPGQAVVYGRVLDRMTLVTTRRHLQSAAAAVPSWWGLATCDGLELAAVRGPAPNPDVELFAVAQLLWREEVLDELRRRGLARGLARARRWVLWQRLAADVPRDELRALVRARLRARPVIPQTRTTSADRP